MNKVLCIIPARSGSKEIKNKNIKKFNGKPLIYYSIQFAKKLKFINKIIFSTDSKRYLNYANKYYRFGKLLRPKRFSKDNSKAIDYVKFEINRLKNYKEFKFLLLLQPTSPFREKKKFIQAFKILKKNLCDSIISSKIVKQHPLLMHKYKNKVVYFSKNYKRAFAGRQSYPKLYLRQGSMYFTKISTLLKTNSLHGGKTKHIVMNGKFAIDLDSKEDLILLKNYFKNN